MGTKLISDLRNLSLEVFKRWKLWMEWYKCMRKWAWKNARNTKGYVLDPKFETSNMKSNDILDKELEGSQVSQDEPSTIDLVKGLEQLEAKDF